MSRLAGAARAVVAVVPAVWIVPDFVAAERGVVEDGRAVGGELAEVSHPGESGCPAEVAPVAAETSADADGLSCRGGVAGLRTDPSDDLAGCPAGPVAHLDAPAVHRAGARRDDYLDAPAAHQVGARQDARADYLDAQAVRQADEHRDGRDAYRDDPALCRAAEDWDDRVAYQDDPAARHREAGLRAGAVDASSAGAGATRVG